MSVERDGAPVALPRSRKVRALLVLLALERAPVTRARACDLLWDVPNDPRGELRWCLSKLRSVLDDDDRKRVVTPDAALLALDLSDCDVDALKLETIIDEGVATVTTERLRAASELGAELLEGTEVDGPELGGWLAARRQRLRDARVAVLAELTARSSPASEDTFRWLQPWLQIAPFDVRAHAVMLEALAARGRPADAERHANATIRAFEQEGLDWAPIRDAWTRTRAPTPVVSAPRGETPAPAPEKAPRHGSVVIMPFVQADGSASPVANGLTDDIITRLAKLRSLFVIARGTAYSLHERAMTPVEAGRLLDVAYVVSGTARRDGHVVTVRAELADTKTAAIVWTDEITSARGETSSVLDSIVDRIVATVAEEIERAECRRTMLKPASSLDAWEAYHRGLWHMYKFTADDNRLAARFFADAIARDATFARAHAGLSFTHFQNVFLGLTEDREQQLSLALRTAGDSIAADDRDPAAHWSMGRALWLRGDDGAVSELERSVELSPNFALGHYTLGFVQAQSGDPVEAVRASDRARALSPFDPLQFGMLGSLALSHMRLGDRELAAEWAVRAASRPNAHVHMLTIAAANLALLGRRDRAREYVARIRARAPAYRLDDFLSAFRFAPDAEGLIRTGAKRVGFE